MRTAVQKNVSAADYLEMEKHSDVKHEFIYGNIIEMPGTTVLHGRIIKQFCRVIDATLHKNGFESFTTDLKVEIEDSKVFFYPDIIIAKEVLQEESSYFIKQPILIGEVLSPSTRTYDSIDKFIQFKKLESLQYYLLIDTEKQIVIFYERTADDEWPSSFFTQSSEIIELPQLGISISLKDIYPQ